MEVFVIFLNSALIWLVSFQTAAAQDTFFDPDVQSGLPPPEDGENSKYFSIKLRVSDIPGSEFIKVFGENQSFRDAHNMEHRSVEFLGIPYATPALADLRFQRPTLYVPDSDFKAIQAAEPCPQIAINGAVLGSEDCLHLNIYVPQGNDTESASNRSSRANSKPEKLPVLVWFHGESPDRSADGKFGVLASGSALDLDPAIFLQHNIIVVTPQYRLGSLGFLSTVNEDLNGNMGLFDQLLSLEWVQRFIIDFGGDPNQVTVMGHGSSAMTIGLLATSDLGKGLGLFQRMIMMGGSPLSPVSLDFSPRQTFAEAALQNSCPSFPTLRFVRCMQQKEFGSIVRTDDSNFKGKHLGKVRIPLPVIQRDSDGRFLPPILSTSPASSLAAGNFEHVPIILGVSSAEMSGFISNPPVTEKTTQHNFTHLGISGRELNELPTGIFASTTVLKQFIRAILLGRGGSGRTDPEIAADLVAFEYFTGLNISDPARSEQAIDILEEMLSDFLFHVPALSLAKLWSRFAPVYFYVFDYVPTPEASDEEADRDQAAGKPGFGQSEGQGQGTPFPTNLQASHGSDLRFLMRGYNGSAEDREVANALVDFWINFIHKGSPLHAGLDWPQFREDTKKYLLINGQVEIDSAFRGRQEYLWSDLIPEMNRRSCSAGSTSEFGSRRKFSKNGNNALFNPFEKQSTSTSFNLNQDRSLGQSSNNLFRPDDINIFSADIDEIEIDTAKRGARSIVRVNL